MNYANWLQRAAALLVDWAPIIVLNIISNVISNGAITFLVFLINAAWWIYNRGYLAGTTGQSWGKKLLNIRLIGEQTGQPIGFGMALARDICHLLDILPCLIGLLFPLWDAKRQTFADKILTTVDVTV